MIVFALCAPRLGRAAAAGLALLLLVPGWFGAQRLLEARDQLPALVGRGLAQHTAPGDVVLTDFDCNPLRPGRGDEHLDKRPEVTFYSDRKVRGLVGAALPDAVALPVALERLPARGGARWFLLTPWPPGPGPELAPDLASRAAGPPQRLADNPPVELYRLAP